MTFVIIGGGIDLSVGAIVALVVGLVHHGGHPEMAEDTHWIVHGAQSRCWSAPRAAWSTAC